MRTRRVMVMGLAALTAMLLGGCVATGPVVDKATRELALQNLTSELEAVPSVTTVNQHSTNSADHGLSVDLQIAVDELVADDVLSVVASTANAFASPALVNAKVTFGLSAANGAQLNLFFPLSVPPDTMQMEVNYWTELSSAYGGPLTMTLTDGVREIMAVGDDPDWEVDWAALRSVPDRSTAQRYWTLGGLWFADAFPTDAVFDLQAGLTQLMENDQEQLSVEQSWPDYVAVQFQSAGAEDPRGPAASPAWPRALAAVQLIVDAGLPVADFAYGTDPSHGSYVHFGQCGTEVFAQEVDERLWNALATSNLALPEGSGAGLCGHALGEQGH